ncbi:hypothetical protein NJ76_25095 [Rhodococcus sp. IITR03]|nr:hypothetical protein NJ76_25095 [Rhodococcus sp. IITR03]
MPTVSPWSRTKASSAGCPPDRAPGGLLGQSLHEGLLGVRGDQRGPIRTGQVPRPGIAGGRRVLLHEPPHIVPVGTYRRENPGVRIGAVQHEEFLQQQRRRPTVEQDVVVREHQPVIVRSHPDQAQAHQRSVRRVETLRPVLGLQTGQFRRTVIRIQVAQIPLTQRQFDRCLHDLHGRGLPVEDEVHPQVRMPRRQGGHRPPEASRIDDTAQVQGQLHRVRVERIVPEGMEQKAGLQGGEGPHVLEAGITALELVEAFLAQRDQRRSDGVCPPAPGSATCRARPLSMRRHRSARSDTSGRAMTPVA